MIERVKLLMSVKNLSSAQLAEMIGVQRSGISHILSERNKPSLDFVLKVLDAYPELNEMWLLKGEGEMLKGSLSQPSMFEGKSEIVDAKDDDDIINNLVQEPLEVRSEDAPYYGKPFQESDSNESEIEANLVNDELKKPVDVDLLYNSKPSSESGKKAKQLLKLIAIYSDDSFKVFHTE